MSAYSWRFFVAGGVDQVSLQTTEDLRALASLDPKLWVALACPVNGHDMDPRTMALIDTNQDERVRVPEVLAAVEFVCKHLKDPSVIFGDPGALPLSQIRDDGDGAVMLAAARGVLASAGKGSANEISVADIADLQVVYGKLPLNGDGVLPADSAGDPTLAAVVEQIVSTVGGVADRGGKTGVDAAKIEAFFAACADWTAWSARGISEAATLLPLGDNTGAAHSALTAVQAKIDDYFARCRLAAFDGRSLGALNRAEGDFQAFGAVNLSADSRELEGFPLATVAAGRGLPLVDGVNPAWSARIAAFKAQVVVPLLGERDTLTPADWARVVGVLAPYGGWQGAVGGAAVAGLGAARIAELLAGDSKARLLARLGEDAARKAETDSIAQVERLVRYHAHLGRLLRNFVNFGAFYGRKELAVFQAGTLYIDQRSCQLTVRVLDAGRHASMAGLAGAYLIYLDCVRRSDGLTMSICAAITDGDSDNLMVGRNGVFYDRQGRDYDARITRIVDNPISVRQAFWSPYKKFLRMVEDLVASRAAKAEAESQAMTASAAESTANADKVVADAAAAPAKEPEAAKPIDVGTVAAIGVAVGGISAVLGGLLETFFGLGIWMPVGILGLILLISGPSMLIAALKLRRRNLGPLLDADGWAVNSQARVNIPLGRSLTQLAELPDGAVRDLNDPFAQKPSRWPYVVAFLLIVAAAAFTWYAVAGNTTM